MTRRIPVEVLLQHEGLGQQLTPHQRWENEQREALAVRDEARRQLAIIGADKAAARHRAALTGALR